MTRADLETFIVGAAEAFFAKAKMSIAKNGTNVDLNGPIDSALRRIGVVPTIHGQPSSADIEKIPDGTIIYFKRISMAETFIYIAGRLAAVDQNMPASGQKLSQYIDQALTMAKYYEEIAKEAEIVNVDPLLARADFAVGQMKRIPIPGEMDCRYPDRWI